MATDDEGRRRLSITKSQRQTQVAIDLIALCQHLTEDGRLSTGEMAGLRDWLADNRDSDLPAIGFLSDTVDRILADGRVTPEEERELYLAIETVLPPDIRSAVKGTRTTLERAEKEAAKAQRAAEKQAEREAEERDSPFERFDFMVAGVVYEGRVHIVRQHARPGQTVFLMREPRNVYSSNATLVLLPNGLAIGYVPEKEAVDLAPLLDGGAKHCGILKKILHGGRAPYPVVVVDLYHPEAQVPEAVLQDQVPARREPPPPPTDPAPPNSWPAAPPARKSGCLVAMAAVATAALLAILK